MQSDRFLNARMSVFLNFVRGGAAFAVLIGHAGQIGLFGNWPFDDTFQHAVVVIFFVLSGLMIQEAASREGVTLSLFAKARVARILPVTLFALALSMGLFVYFARFFPHNFLYPDDVNLTSGAGVAALLFFSQRFGGTEPLLDPPFWSLRYEIWFYIFFGLWTFLRGWKRVVATTVAVMLADAPILLLLPTWLIGSWVSLRGIQVKLNRPTLILTLALAGFAICSWSGVQHRFVYLAELQGIHLRYLRFSVYFLPDAIAGAFFALAVVALRAIPGESPSARLRDVARWCASISFPLYLTHWPLLATLYFVVQPSSAILGTLSAVIAPVIFAALLAPLFDRKLPQMLRGLFARPIHLPLAGRLFRSLQTRPL